MNKNPLNITRDDVLELAAQKIADQYADSNELTNTVDSRLAKRIEAVVGGSLQKRVDEFLSAELSKLIEREIVPVDIYGDPTGKPTTIRAALHEKSRTFWSETVDGSGNPSKGYGVRPRHEWLFQKLAGEAFADAVKQNIVDVLGGLKEAIREDARKNIDSALNELLRVKSLKEQGK